MRTVKKVKTAVRHTTANNHRSSTLRLHPRSIRTYIPSYAMKGHSKTKIKYWANEKVRYEWILEQLCSKADLMRKKSVLEKMGLTRPDNISRWIIRLAKELNTHSDEYMIDKLIELGAISIGKSKDWLSDYEPVNPSYQTKSEALVLLRSNDLTCSYSGNSRTIYIDSTKIKCRSIIKKLIDSGQLLQANFTLAYNGIRVA